MWQDESVFYQIYPLGACGAPFENDGKLEHRILKLAEGWPEHLEKLGVNALILNPVFASESHGYNVLDYQQVDCRLGTQDDLRQVCDAFHSKGIRILFDAVFNHVGRGHPYFQDVLKNRENSPWKDWFKINFYGNNSRNDGLWYQNWEGHDELVEWNLDNPAVRDYLISQVWQWRELYGIDGLRLDVGYRLHPAFLRELRQAFDSDFFLLAETLHGDYKTVVNAEMADSSTNYECWKGLYSSFNSRNMFELIHSLNRQFGKESWCLYRGLNLLSFADNHDVSRIASQLTNKNLLPALYAILFTMPGIPCIYYGSEWGMEGIKNADDTALRPETAVHWNELSDWIAELAALRKSDKRLAYGGYGQVALTNTACIFERDGLWTCVNIDQNPASLRVPYGGTVWDVIKNEPLQIDGQVYLEPESFLILDTKKTG